MPAYIKPKDPAEIADKVVKAAEGRNNNVLFVGCGHCPNVSACVYHNDPDEPTFGISAKPVARPLHREYDAVARELEERGFTTERAVTLPLCYYLPPTVSHLQKKAADADTIVVYSCAGGIRTLVEAVGKDKKIVSGGTEQGSFSAKLGWSHGLKLSKV